MASPPVGTPWFEKTENILGSKLKGLDDIALFARCPGYGTSETSVVQPWWTDRIKKLPEFRYIKLVDTFDRATFGTRKPGNYKRSCDLYA